MHLHFEAGLDQGSIVKTTVDRRQGAGAGVETLIGERCRIAMIEGELVYLGWRVRAAKSKQAVGTSPRTAIKVRSNRKMLFLMVIIKYFTMNIR